MHARAARQDSTTRVFRGRAPGKVTVQSHIALPASTMGPSGGEPCLAGREPETGPSFAVRVSVGKIAYQESTMYFVLCVHSCPMNR